MLVLNASPVIVLTKARLIEPVLETADQVVIPSAVAAEVVRAPEPDDPAMRWVKAQPADLFALWEPAIPQSIAAWDLGAGESAVLALCLDEPGAVAGLDDRQGRKCARSIGVPVIGTLGLIARAHQSGFLPDLEDALQRILDAGLYISPQHLDLIRRSVRARKT